MQTISKTTVLATPSTPDGEGASLCYEKLLVDYHKLEAENKFLKTQLEAEVEKTTNRAHVPRASQDVERQHKRVETWKSKYFALKKENRKKANCALKNIVTVTKCEKCASLMPAKKYPPGGGSRRTPAKKNSPGSRNSQKKGQPTSAKKEKSRERQRRYRERLRASPNGDRLEEARRKDRERWRKRQEKIRGNDRNLRVMRRKWRESQRRCRQRKRDRERLPTPEKSPERPNTSDQKKRGRKQLRRDRSRSYRKVKKLEEQLAAERRKSERYKKRLQRVRAKSKPTSTPAKKVDSMLRGTKVTSGVRKKLLFSTAVVSGLRKKYKESKSMKEKQVLTKLVQGCTRKYQMLQSARSFVGIPRKPVADSEQLIKYTRKPSCSLAARLGKKVSAFLEREDNSRMTTGKKDTLTKAKVKKQRRLLCETMERLHRKYCDENPNDGISYSLFCRLRPFYIVAPTNRDRETCLCRTHENARLLIQRLAQLKLLHNVNSVEDAVAAAVCKEPSEDCYNRDCPSCREHLSEVKPLPDSETAKERVTWGQWATVKEKRTIKNKEVQVTRTILQDVEGTTDELAEVFLSGLPKLCRHVMVMRQQWQSYHHIKSTGACTVVVDFSENFSIVRKRAVQSSHFGASNTQLSLHTGVGYTSKGTYSFCTVSECTRHDPAAIWAHLDPVISYLKSKEPEMCTIHFWSDAPNTQYRNKQNFALFSRCQEYGFPNCTWNFFEAGHGKGPADAIGGIVKRAGDDAINHGKEIHNAHSFVQAVAAVTKVKMIVVNQNNIDDKDSYLASFGVIKPVNGTMKLHQIQAINPSVLSVRNLSCFCTSPTPCSCLGAKIVRFPEPTQTQPRTLVIAAPPFFDVQMARNYSQAPPRDGQQQH